ncbi:MAG: 5-formyltetrahydrofolate cyclo-ligase, partial [Planctomycetota bacterium]
MTAPDPTLDTKTLKQEIRRQAHENRRLQPDKDEVSRRIVARFMELPEYQEAGTVMFYVDVRDEVRTRHALPDALESGKRIVIPFCVDGELELFHLESMEELDVGMYKIL